MSDRPDAKEVFKTLSDFVNNYNSDKEGFIKEFKKEHRTLQQSLGRLFLECLEECAEEDYDYDLRNESLHEVSKKMINSFREENGYKPSKGLPLI